MLQINENEVSVHLCTFEANFQKAKVNLRFPSLFFIEWKAINNKNSVSTVGRKKAVNSLIELDQLLTFSTEMIYHRIQKQYLKKQSLIHLNLISNSRPDQIKLVGRVIIDLAEVANKNNFAEVTTLKLMYCSVDAELTFKIKFMRSIQSNLELNELDKSAFSDLYSFTSPKIGIKNKLEYRDSLSEKRSDDERRKIPKMVDRQEIVNVKPTRPKSPKIQKILIRQQFQQTAQHDNPRSLPLSQKKKSLKDYNEYRADQKRTKPVYQIPQCAAQQAETIVNKQRNQLEQELNVHKERIKKLQNEIKKALRMFEESEQKSEINKSKLIESEQAINKLRDKENKIKADYEKIIAAQNEQHQKQITIIKSGYEVDIKILQATMEEERNRLLQLEKTSKNLLDSYHQAKTKIKEQDMLLSQAGFSKKEIDALKIEKQQLLMRLSEKQTDQIEILSLRQKNQQQLSKVKSWFEAELQKMNTILKAKEETITNLQHSSQNLIVQLNALREQNTQLSNGLQVQKHNHEKVVSSLQQQITMLKSLQKQQIPAIPSQQNQTLKNRIIYLQSALQTQKTRINVDLQNKQQELSQLRLQNEQLRTQNQTGKQIIQILRNQRTQIDLQLDHLKTENKQLAEMLRLAKQSIENKQAIIQSNAPQALQIVENVGLQNEQVKNLKDVNQQLKHLLEVKTQEIKNLERQLQNFVQVVKSKEQQVVKINEQTIALKQLISLHNILLSQKAQIPQVALKTDPSIQKTPEKLQSIQAKEQIIQVSSPVADSHALNLNFDFLSNNFNKSAQVSEEDRHRYHFEEYGSPLTNEQVNKIERNINFEGQLNTLKEQNMKLKEEIEYLKQLTAAKQGQTLQQMKKRQNIISTNSEIVQKLQQERESLNEQLICLNQQIKVLSQRPTLQIGDVKPVNLHNLTQYQKIEEYKRIISQQYQKHQFLQSRIFQLEGLLSKNNERMSHIEKDEHYIQDLEERLANLEEQLKIKDQLLGQSEKNMEESYAIKYQLADLKQKFNELKSALDERDIYINELEETKEYLAKELEQTSPQKNHSFVLKLQKIDNEYSPLSSHINNSHINNEVADLKNEIEQLNRQLIIYNNENTELKNRSQDWKNEKIEMENLVQVAKLKLIENENMINQLKTQKQKLELELEDQRVKQEENRERINGQINLLTGKLLEMENNLRAIHDNETELNQLRQAVQSLNVQKNALNESLLLKQQTVKQLSSQIQALNAEIAQIQVLNNELSSNLNKGETELLQKMNQSQKLQTQLSESKTLNTQLNRKLEESNQSINNLKKQIQEANFQIEKLRKQREITVQQQQRLLEEKMINNDLNIEINIHKVDSYAEDEVPPIVYEKSVIQSEEHDVPQNEGNSYSEQLEKLTQHNQKLNEDNRLLSQDNQKLKNQVETLNQEVARYNKQIQKLQTELAHQNQQKFYYFNEVETNKAVIQKLEKQIKANNDKNQRLNILPLQSFDTNHLLGRRHHQQIITQDQKQRQPSILQQIQVRAQPEVTHRSQEQMQSLSFKKGTEAKTQGQTNMTEESVVALMRDLELVKQQLQKEKKQHKELQETHKICINKFDLLSARYESCFNELEYVQGEVDHTLKSKKKIEEELYHSKVVIQNLNDQERRIAKENQQLKELIYIQDNKQIVIANNDVNQSPKDEQVKVAKVQQEKETERYQLQKAEYENKISQLSKSHQQYKNKAALLEQNIQNLQKMLQEQIEINQNNQKLAEKLQTLHQLEAMAEQVQSEMIMLKKENTELKKMKTQSDITPHEKGELTKIIEEYETMNNPKDQLKPKLENIEEMHSNSQSHVEAVNQQVEDKIIEPVQTIKQEDPKPEKSQLANSSPIQNKNENAQHYANSEVPPRNEDLLLQIEQLRRQKLQNLQKLYQLQQKINEISSVKATREQQNEQELNLRLIQIEQLRFANEQINREYQEQKNINSQLEFNKQTIKVQFDELMIKYQQAQTQIQKLNKSIAEYLESINHYHTELAELQNNIFILQQEKSHFALADQVNNEIQKVKVELEQLSNEKALLSQQIVTLNQQMAEMRSILQGREHENKQKQEKLKSLGQLQDQISQQKQILEKQIKQLEQKSSRMEQQLSIIKNRGESIDEKMTSLNNQLNQADKKIAVLNAKIKAKEEQSLAFAKENQQLKTLNASNEQKIRLLGQKEKQMKQTVALLEQESKKIVDSIKQRFVSEANYYKKYVEKQKECSSLSAAAAEFQQSIAHKERQLNLERQIAFQLRNELDVLKNGAGALELPHILTIQMKKYEQLKDAHQKLMNVNKEYLQNIGKKSTINVQNQRLKQQLKNLTISFNQANSMLNQIKTQYQSKKIEYTDSLSKIEEKLVSENQKVIALDKQLLSLKENKVASDLKYYDKLIAQKNREIEALRRQIQDIKLKKGSELREQLRETPSELDILNEQVYNLSNDILERERQISQLKKELDHLKQIQSPTKQKTIENSSVFKRKGSQAQAENKITEIEIQLSNVTNNIHNTGQEKQVNNQNLNAVAQQLSIICEQIKELCNNRNSNNKQGLFTAFVNRYDQLEEQFQSMGLQTTQIQEKARFISKELQKLKAYIIKSQNRAFKQKTQILALIKPCEHTANELISLSETLNEGDSNAFL